MLTTCTACGTQFRVSTSQLRSVHGLVRCSRCHSVFDAFETLREEFEATPPAPTAALVPEKLPDIKPVATEIPQSMPSFDTTSTPAVDVADLDIKLPQENTQLPVDDLFAELWGKSAAPAATPVPMDNNILHADKDVPMLIEDRIPKPAALERDQALYKHVKLPPREFHVPKTSRQPLAINGWGIGVVLLALLLGIQVLNAHRQELSHSPVMGPPLAALYSVLGHPVSAPQRPDTWLVSSINVTSDPETPGALSITGTLANSAGFAQPWPILRIELTDRYGDALRARDFTANMYLPSNQLNVLLNPGMAARFRIDVADPGPEAVGFQVQPCVDLADGRQCSSGTTSD